jgi:AcrR family transcriptional regulator
VEGRSQTLRAVRSWEEAVPRQSGDEGVLEAMLLAAGELGYGGATVQEVAKRASISRDRFLRRFGSKEACFAEAYGRAADALCEQLLEAGRGAEGWRQGFRAALAALLRTVAEQPLLAKALLIEVRAARGQAWVKHQEVVERLTEAVDAARREPGALPSATPFTAGFTVGAVEESVCLEIGAGRAAEAERLLPGLLHLVILNYFGEDAAWSELDAGESGDG